MPRSTKTRRPPPHHSPSGPAGHLLPRATLTAVLPVAFASIRIAATRTVFSHTLASQ